MPRTKFNGVNLFWERSGATLRSIALNTEVPMSLVIPLRLTELVRFRGALLVASLLLSSGPASADAVTEWNAIMETTVANVDPFLQVRSATITQLAVFEAVNSILGDYEPYLGTITAPEGASAEAAAVAAAHRALSVLHPDSAATLDERRAASLEQILDGPAKDQGLAVGIAAADAILALRADDGSNEDVPYTPGTELGDWQPTPPDFAPAFRPGLGQVATFGIEHGAQFRLRPPPVLHSDRYARDYNEVKKYGDVNSTERPQDRTDVVRFSTGIDAVQLYYPAARQVSAAQGKSLAENARIFALLSMAICDGAIAVFDTKYFYNFWRPVAAIHAHHDGNRRTFADPDWMPLKVTPPFPTYPSGAAGFGAAARRVLEELFGRKGHSITLTNPLVPEIVLHYTSWKEITDDVGDAIVFGGIHFRFDQEEAARQGRRVGGYILKHQLRPIRGRDH